jgi:hypothetical protein
MLSPAPRAFARPSCGQSAAAKAPLPCLAVPQVHALTCQTQNRVRPLRALLQGLDSFGRWQYLELYFPAMSLAVHLFHHRQRSGSGADHKPSALPGYLLLYRERRTPKPVTEPFGRFFLALADAATVDHDVIRVSRSVNADRAK